MLLINVDSNLGTWDGTSEQFVRLLTHFMDFGRAVGHCDRLVREAAQAIGKTEGQIRAWAKGDDLPDASVQSDVIWAAKVSVRAYLREPK